jgi:signal transduction histidine kinase
VTTPTTPRATTDLQPGARPADPLVSSPEPRRSAARRLLSGVRARVVAGYVLLLAAALVASTLTVRQVLLARLDREIDRALAQEVEEVRRLVGGNDPRTGTPFGDDAAAIFDTFLSRNVPTDGEAFYTVVGGEAYLSSFEAPAPLLEDERLLAQWSRLRGPERLTVETEVGEARTLAVPLRNDGRTMGTFVVAFFPAAARDEVLQAVRIVAVVGAVVLVVASLLAWSLAGRVLRPVRELTRTARRISESDLTARIPVEGNDELAELGRTFNAMLDRIEDAFRSQRRFLDDVAHELRTPITIVRGHLEVQGDDPAERAETIAVVTDELDRMSRYVSDLLIVAKAQQPDFLHLGLVDLGELSESLLAKVSAMDAREWELEAAPPPGHAYAQADPDRLTQAVLNLVANAVQHTAPGDRIRVGIAADGEWARLWVGDSGPGVDPEIRAELFQRFSRGAGSRVDRPEGTGLGLTIVAAIAEAHGGRADVSSTPGNTTFSITIPLLVDEQRSS